MISVMGLPVLPNLYLPRMRSFISSKYVTPIEWMDEIEKYGYQYDEIISVIEIYEFIIACLIKAVPPKENNQSLIEKADGIFNKTEHYTSRYFNSNPKYEKILNFVLYIKKPTSIKKKDAKKLEEYKNQTYKERGIYECLRGYYEFIFGKKELVQENENVETNGNDNELIKYVNIQKEGYTGINNLLDFFERKKAIYQKNASTSMERKTILGDKIFLGISAEIDRSANEIKKTVERIAFETQQVVREDGVKTRELMKEAMKITNEILDRLPSVPPKYRKKCAQKLWMIARHPEFIKPLEILLKSGIVQEKEKTYYFSYSKARGEGYKLLAYVIFKYAKLEKWAEPSKSKSDSEFKGFFTKRVYEPFSEAFGINNLETNIRGDDIPVEYADFRIESGLKDCKPIR